MENIHVWTALLHELLNMLGILDGMTFIDVVLGFLALFVLPKIKSPRSQQETVELVAADEPEARWKKHHAEEVPDSMWEETEIPPPHSWELEHCWDNGDNGDDVPLPAFQPNVTYRAAVTGGKRKKAKSNFSPPQKKPAPKQVGIPFNMVSLNCLGDRGEKTIQALIEELKQVKNGVSVFALQEVSPKGQLLEWAPSFLNKKLGGNWVSFIGTSGESQRLAFLVNTAAMRVVSCGEVKNRFPQGAGRRVPLQLEVEYRELKGVITDIHFARRRDDVEVNQSRAADGYLGQMQRRYDFVLLVGDQNSDQNADDETICRKGYGLFLKGLPRGFETLAHVPTGEGTFFSKRYFKSILDEATAWNFRGLVHILGLGRTPEDPNIFQLGGSDHKLELITGEIIAA